jgi:hypothetical protein
VSADEFERDRPRGRSHAEAEAARIEQAVHRGEDGQERPEREDEDELAAAQFFVGIRAHGNSSS